MEEIKVGDYIRTIDGYIRKVIQVNKKGSYDGLCHGAFNLDKPYKYSQGVSVKKIKSHSPNIIDLIEIGDYVNRYKVLEIRRNDNRILIGVYKDTETVIYKTLANENVKSIVTHEQFKAIKYKVEE